MTDTDHFEGGIATLRNDGVEGIHEDAPFKVSGVALPEQTIVNGGQNTDHFYSGETLQEAADLLEGQQIVKNFHQIEGQANADQVIGKITSAGYEKGVGLVFEGEVADEDIAEKVELGYLDVSPTVARQLGEFDETMGAQEVERISGFRDLAVVANGQPGAGINIGGNPAVTALGLDALSRGFETLETDSTPPLDESVSVPENAQNAAQAALDADDEGLIPESCGTGTGTTRAEMIANDNLTVADFLTRNEDMTPVPAYLNSHAEDATTTDPPTEWGEDEWESCGNAGLARWGWDVDWFTDKANELAQERNEQEPYADTLQSDSKTVAGVTFIGTKTGELDESEIPTDDYEPHYLYPADTKSDSSYPVVDGDGFLRKGNVEAAFSLGARGGVDAEEHDNKLMDLADEFETPPEFAQESDTMADVDDVSEGSLVRWDSSGDRPAYGEVVDIRTEGDEPLDGEIDGDQTINPPAALIEVHTPGEDGWEASGTMVGHSLNTDTLTVIESLPDPDSLSGGENRVKLVAPDTYTKVRLVE